MEKGTYYLSRVVKTGEFHRDKSTFPDAIVGSAPIVHRKFAWAIIDVIDNRNGNIPFIYGRLAKFSLEGHISQVDLNSRLTIDSIAKNLLVASAPFVYLPQYSGIAFLHVWNHVAQDVFPRRFKKIVEAGNDGFFFAECTIEPISDYREFVAKLNDLDVITDLKATVNPPNPLFGHIWRDLKEYLANRNATEIRVQESSVEGEALKTDLIDIINAVILDEGPIPPASLTDAAILMAADGYGHGRVQGLTKGHFVRIRTSETQKHFEFDREPKPEDLASIAATRFTAISDERGMEHG